MPAVDTHGFIQEHVGKRMSLELTDGESEEIHLIEIAVCSESGPCCGIVNRLLSTGRGNAAKQNGEVYFRGFPEIAKHKVIGD